MAIPGGPLKCVAAIGYADEGETIWMASGFLYAPAKQRGRSGVFLVTNRHVIEGFSELVVRLEGASGSSHADVRVHAAPAGDSPYWVGHPDPEVDIAVTRVRPAVVKGQSLEADATSQRAAASRSELKAAGFGEGDAVFVLGFPMGLVDESLHLAIVRQGTVARCRDVYEGASPAYLLDVTVFPGNSGSPVFARLPIKSPVGESALSHSLTLIGIVTSYLSFHDVAYSAAPRRPRVIFEENSGLALAHPMDLVDETIDAYWASRSSRTSAGSSKRVKTKSPQREASGQR